MAEYTVRKCYVKGKLSDHDWKRLMQELDTQHRNKNKFIGIDQNRRELVRQVQAEHPTIGMLTAEYNKAKGEKAEIVRAAAKEFDRQLTAINARIRDAKKAEQPVTELITKRKAIEKERKQTIAKATEKQTALLNKLADKLREAKDNSKSKITKIRDRAKEIKKALTVVNAKIAVCKDKDERLDLMKKKELLKEALRTVRAQADEHDIYAVINKHTEELKRLACHDLPDEEAQQYGFRFGQAGHSGTKWWIKENAEQAAKARSKNMSAEHDPKFLRFSAHYLSGEIRGGTLCAGISQSGPSGLLTSYNSPNKSKLYIPEPPSSSAYDKRALTRGARKRAQRADVYFRIGTVKVHDPATNKMVERPEWLHLPQVGFHHEFPEGAVIVETYLKLESIGTHRKLWVIFTLKVEPPKPIVPQTMGSATIRAQTQLGDGALTYATIQSDLEQRVLWHSTDPRRQVRRWAKLNGKTSGVRRDEKGRLGRFVNGNWTYGKDLTDLYTYAEGILGTQSDWLQCLPDGKSRPKKDGEERIGSKFVTTVLGYIASADNLPPCLAEAAANDVFHWRSTGKLQRLYRRWATERIEGDEEAFAAMKAWADHDLHLYQWARSMLARLTRRKIDVFRKEALYLCRTYKTLYVDDVDTTKREDGFTEDQAKERTKWEKRAGFGLFREILKKTANRCGTELVIGFPQETQAA